MICLCSFYRDKLLLFTQSLSTMVIKSNDKDILEKTAEKLIMINDNLKTANVKLREKMQVKDRQTFFKDDIQNSLNSMDITPELRIIFNKITDKVSDLENKIVDMQDHLDCLPLRQLIEGTRISLWLEYKGVYGTNQDEPNKSSWKSFYEFVKLKNDAKNVSFISILEDDYGSLSNKIHVSDGKYNHKVIAQSILRLPDSHKNKYINMYEFLFKEPFELQLL